MRRPWLGIAFAFGAIACSKDQGEAGTPEQGAQSPSGATQATAGGATINGTVSFTGAAPENPPIDMSEEAACKAKHTGQARDPQVVVNDGKLANVVVYVKSGLPAGQSFSPPAEPVVLDQNGCLYAPRMLAVMAGQNIEIRNSDPVLHNIKAVPKENRGFNISQPSEGMKTTRTFSVPETVPLECNVHSWMHANAKVLSHPFFATTGPDGAFTIKGLPPGTYEIEAQHDKLGTRTVTVTVTEGGTGAAAFTFGSATS